MNENEAVKDLDIIRLNPHWNELVKEEYWQELMEMSMNALKEVQQYREIGTVEECRTAVEKQTAKKPYLEQAEMDECWECPTCDSFIGYEVDCRDEHYRENNCPNCGQKLDWSDVE